MSIVVTPRGRAAFDHFVQCQDTNRLPRIELDPDGFSAVEVFCHRETHGGHLLPCREPVELSRALNGKEWNGLTCTMVAEDMVECMVTLKEVMETYPKHVAKEIVSKAHRHALATVGFIPRFLTEPTTPRESAAGSKTLLKQD
jgi:hypothetical protein